MTRFAAVARDVVARCGPAAVRRLADLTENGVAAETIKAELPDAADLIAAVPDIGPGVAATYLRGIADGYATGAGQHHIDVVWTGPSVHDVPTRATAQVLTELIWRARHDLLLVTYSAAPYPPVMDALGAACDRGVTVDAIVETLQGAGSALSGSEPAAAFSTLPAIKLWHWPKATRPVPGAKMHAKIAIADRRELLVSSANLTASGAVDSIEAGLLVRGGTAPIRASEHITGLIAAGVLVRLR